MGFLGSVFALSISLTQNPVELIGQCTDNYTKSKFIFFFFFLNYPNPVSTYAASLVIWEFQPFLSLPRCSLSNKQQLNPAFLPHFYRFLGYKRFHLLLHVLAFPPSVVWCTVMVTGGHPWFAIRHHHGLVVFGLRVGFFCARVVCARLRILLLPFNWCC